MTWVVSVSSLRPFDAPRRSLATDVKWMGWSPKVTTHTSDYFPVFYAMALELIDKGKAYVCHQSSSEIEACRKVAKARSSLRKHEADGAAAPASVVAEARLDAARTRLIAAEAGDDDAEKTAARTELAAAEEAALWMEAAPLRRGMNKNDYFSNSPANFGRLVLFCIEADFCIQIRILQHFSRSTK